MGVVKAASTKPCGAMWYLWYVDGSCADPFKDQEHDLGAVFTTLPYGEDLDAAAESVRKRFDLPDVATCLAVTIPSEFADAIPKECRDVLLDVRTAGDVLREIRLASDVWEVVTTGQIIRGGPVLSLRQTNPPMRSGGETP